MKWVRMSIVLLVLVQLAGPWAWIAAAGGEIIRQGVLIPYEITGPEGWAYQVEPHQYVLGVFKPEGDDLLPHISITKSGGISLLMTHGTANYELTPDDLVELNLYARPGARLLSSRWIGEENDSFMLAEFSWSSELGEVRSIKAFHPWKDMVLVVTATCLATDYDEYRETLLDSVMSLRIKGHPDEKKQHKAEATGGDDWLYDQ